MNDKFNIQRFGALFARYWAEKKMANILLGLVTLALLGWFFEYIQQDSKKTGFEPTNMHQPVFIVGFSVFMLVQMAFSFVELTKRKTSANFLMIPSSLIEKYLFLLVNHLILPILFYCISVLVMDWLIAWIFNPVSGAFFLRTDSGLFNHRYDRYLFVVVSFSVLYVFVGYFSFLRNHLIYSVLTLVLVFYIGLTLLDGYIVKEFISQDLISSSVLDGVTYGHNKYYTLLDGGLLRDFQPESYIVVGLFFCAMIYVSYLKFIEKQTKV